MLSKITALFRRIHSREVVLLYANLDRFKHCNLVFGHAVGDTVLDDICMRLAALANRPPERRGDEILLAVSSVDAAHRIAESIRLYAEDRFHDYGEAVRAGAGAAGATTPDGPIATLSIGISCKCSRAAAEHQAYEAMHEAKRAGRNRVAHYDEKAPPVRLSADRP